MKLNVCVINKTPTAFFAHFVFDDYKFITICITVQKLRINIIIIVQFIANMAVWVYNSY